jgi:hypothetical protein
VADLLDRPRTVDLGQKGVQRFLPGDQKSALSKEVEPLFGGVARRD